MAGRHRFQPQIISELGLHLTVAPITLFFSVSAVVAVVTGMIALFTENYRPFLSIAVMLLIATVTVFAACVFGGKN